MPKLTHKKYKCADCDKLQQLVIRRGRGSRCVKCDYAYLVKRNTLRELNKITKTFGE